MTGAREKYVRAVEAARRSARKGCSKARADAYCVFVGWGASYTAEALDQEDVHLALYNAHLAALYLSGQKNALSHRDVTVSLL